jgi:alpha-amylase
VYKQSLNFFRSCIPLIVVYCTTLTITLLYYTPPAKADVIYQAFDMCYQDIKAKLPQLKDNGYTYIQVSPPQTTPERQSNPCLGDDEWYLQYQPINYEIGNALGSQSDLKKLIEAAHSQNMKVLVDVVLNHVAREEYYKNVKNPIFLIDRDFHPKKPICNDNNRNLVTYGWLGLACIDPQKLEILPDLNTESDYVREQAKNYIEKLLLELKADGLRFDAIKHIEPQYFEYVLQNIPHNKYLYGEIIEGNARKEYIAEYTNLGIDITDYPLQIKMLQAFKPSGDLRSLIDPQNLGAALPGDQAVTFARTHDTAFDQKRPRDLCQNPTDQLSNLCFSDSNDPQNEKDTFLAIAYILARQDGFPLIYAYDAENAITLAGVKFHEKMIGKPQHFRNGNEIAKGADNPKLLFIERGSQGLAIINKSRKTFDVKVAKMPGLEAGCYTEQQYGFKMCVGNDAQKYITQWGTSQRGGVNIKPGSALFFLKTDVF